MNRRSFLRAAPAAAFIAVPASAEPQRISPKERLRNAIAEVEAAFRELYPDLKTRRHINEIRDIDQYDPSHVQLVIIAE